MNSILRRSRSCSSCHHFLMFWTPAHLMCPLPLPLISIVDTMLFCAAINRLKCKSPQVNANCCLVLACSTRLGKTPSLCIIVWRSPTSKGGLPTDAPIPPGSTLNPIVNFPNLDINLVSWVTHDTTIGVESIALRMLANAVECWDGHF